jgi:hypothetical protein
MLPSNIQSWYQLLHLCAKNYWQMKYYYTCNWLALSIFYSPVKQLKQTSNCWTTFGRGLTPWSRHASRYAAIISKVELLLAESVTDSVTESMGDNFNYIHTLSA